MRNDKDGLVEHIEASITEEAIILFRRFIESVKRVRNTALLQRGVPSITNISFRSGKKPEFTCGAYQDGELYELLHVLRPLLLYRESASFEKVSGMLGKSFKGEKFRTHLKLLRRIFEDGELRLYMQIMLNNRPLFDDSTLKLWLNGSEYHQDSAKHEQWETFSKSLSAVNTRALVITQLASKVNAIFELEYIVNQVLIKADGTTKA